MRSTITKLATAAVIIIAVVAGITLLEKTTTPAYAIEQTIEAMKNISTIHTFCTDKSNRKIEIWIKVNSQTGENDCHYLNEFERGFIGVSTPEKTYFYDQKNNTVRIVPGQSLRSDLRFGRFIEDLLERENAKIELTNIFDANLGKEVVILKAESTANILKAWLDLNTKLPIKIEFEKSISGQIVKSVDTIYYNQPIPEGLFDFQIPQGAKVIQEPDILTKIDDPNYGIDIDGIDHETACEIIIKKYWSLVIDKNWEEAHKLLPVATIKEIEYSPNDEQPLELIGMRQSYIDRASCDFGDYLIKPTKIRFSNNKIKEIPHIVYFRNINGKESCVLAGECYGIKWKPSNVEN